MTCVICQQSIPEATIYCQHCGNRQSHLDMRSLHIELCRQWGLTHIGREMTADEIIKAWNHKSPEDKW